MDGNQLRQRFQSCPAGHPGWREFEDICVDALSFLFVPPLKEPRRQPRTYQGTERRDAILTNWNLDINNNWGKLRKVFEANMLLCEFKNYDLTKIGSDETSQTASYLNPKIGKLALMVCNMAPSHEAHLMRNSIYSNDKKVILFVTVEDMLEMIAIKERGDDPSDFLIDLIDDFMIQHQ